MTATANPFMRQQAPASLPEPPPPTTSPITGLSRPLEIQGSKFFLKGDWTCDKNLTVVGLHGGSGASTLASLLDAGTCPPEVGPKVLPSEAKTLVFVAEHSPHGAKVALDAARHWASGLPGTPTVAGLVLMRRWKGKETTIPRRVLLALKGIWPSVIVVPPINLHEAPSKKIMKSLESLKGSKQ